MGAYLVRRGLETAASMLLVAFLLFVLVDLMPGDPLDLMLQADPRLTSADIARLKALYGLDRPLLERFGTWLSDVLRGEFGYSRLYSVPVAEILWPRLASTLLLLGTSLLFAVLAALPLGVLAALRAGSLLDRMLNVFAFFGLSVPSFWLALLAIVVFAVLLGWLPAGGEPAEPGLVPVVRHMVLPVSVLALLAFAPLFRFLRAGLREALREPFVRTARAKGAGTARVVFFHALPQATPTLVTILALQLGGLFSGALAVETVFGWLGMGRLIYEAIMGNDYHLALVAVWVGTAAVLLANLAADVLHARLDPRVRLG
ncbi:MAG: ABC transporter permease [Geminicoccaceae bacterium]|nr:ABC transporter permease [Geminicoccaceae bacterium]MCS7266444.1 ABC transporter permease [Geminicoccaceae bacterium]MDW8126036.1 ABC transporter permease [Geminicoccaceae bacterium]